MQLQDKPDFREWLDERKARYIRLYGEPDSGRTWCESCGITTSRSQLLDGVTCIECVARDYGAHRVWQRLAEATNRIAAALASGDVRPLAEHLIDRVEDALGDYDAERQEQ